VVCVWTRKMKKNALCGTKIIESFGSKFTTTISSKNFDFVFKDISYCGFKVLGYVKHIRLEFKQINPDKFSKIINKTK